MSIINNKNYMNQEEIKVLLVFLDRVNLNGKEAESLVYLKNKLKVLLEGTEKSDKETVDKKETPKKK